MNDATAKKGLARFMRSPVQDAQQQRIFLVELNFVFLFYFFRIHDDSFQDGTGYDSRYSLEIII